MAYIVTLIALVLAGVFAILVKVWAGFMYFVLASLMALAIFWGVYLIYKYFKSFKKQLAENFKYFRAQVINSKNISPEQFDSNEAFYQKEYKKKTFKLRFLEWFKIAFCFACAASFLTGMILL